MPDAPANPLAAEAARALGDRLVSANERLGELTLTVRADVWAGACATLRDEPSLAFSMLIDLCGLDYRGHAGWPLEAPRFAVVVHLLSTAHNQRVRVRTLCDDDDFPGVGTLTEVWPAASWFEREAFDLFGIVFDGHPDLRRILTDYGFVGHPFRKDFPVSGHVEMRYDPEQKRVIYQPVTIEPREIVPRVVREASYGTGKGGGG